MKRAFTLIELLIVIAIIGILASVVIVSLEGSQGKSSDEISKTELGQLRTLSAIAKSDDSSVSFAAFCDGTAPFQNVKVILDSVKDRQGTEQTECVDTATTWAAAFSLIETRSDTTAADRTIWCVDSTGYVGELKPAESSLLTSIDTDGDLTVTTTAKCGL